MKFLIADDTPAKLQFLVKLVERAWKFEILTAETTEDACALIEQNPDIAAAFIDYYIPSANGPSVINYLKEKIPTARIALVSSSDNAKNAAEAKAAGAERVICTSDRGDEVERVILGLVEEWQL